jgi:Zn-dependent protease with chaperone function
MIARSAAVPAAGPGRQRSILAYCLGVLLLAASAGAAATPAPVPRNDDPKRFEVRVTEETLRLARIRNLLYFGGTIYSGLALLFILASGLSARMRDLAARLVRRPLLAAVLYMGLFVVVMALLHLPLALYASYFVPHQFGLSNESLSAWFADELKSLLVTIVIGMVVIAAALPAIARFKRWWIALWLGSIPFTIFMVVIAPVVIDPLYNDFQPLRDPVLKQRLLDMADRAGIEGGRVYQVDKSRQTKTLNAYVTGIGPTKRIVLWDTTLRAMTHDEIVTVMGHEMGHYVLHHLWKGLAFGLFVSLIVLWLAQSIFERLLARFGARWRLAGTPTDPAALPLFLLVVAALFFFASPILSGYSRHSEREADSFAIELTGMHEAFATAFVKLAENSKSVPDPHPFIVWWRYSHPPVGERIEWALRGKK